MSEWKTPAHVDRYSGRAEEHQRRAEGESVLLEQIAREAARILERRPPPEEGRPAPGLEMAAAATCLAFRRDEVADDEDLLRLAARAEYDDSPPPGVAAWLADAGVPSEPRQRMIVKTLLRRGSDALRSESDATARRRWRPAGSLRLRRRPLKRIVLRPLLAV